MLTAFRSERSRTGPRGEIPLLYPGDHLTQKEFHRRYEAYPDDTRFELIGGIVYMMAPAGFEHGSSGFDTCGILSWYATRTPGVVGVSGATVLLGERSEPEPDAALLIMPDYGGQTSLKQIKNKHYIQGPPELVLEVSHSTVGIDLHAKRDDYRLAGVLEYVVVCLDEQVTRWFALPTDDELALDRRGVLKSHVFPGLWIDTKALMRRESTRLFATLEQGLASKAHQEFVKKLASAKKKLASGKSGRMSRKQGNKDRG